MLICKSPEQHNWPSFAIHRAMHPLNLIEQHLVRNILSSTAQSQYQTGHVATRELTPYIDSIRTISEQYVHHSVGTLLESPIRKERDALAYALYYSPINAAKMLHLLPKLELSSQRLSVLDVGCGPGTIALALLASLPNAIDFTCIESSYEMRSVATKLIRCWGSNHSLHSLSTKASLSELADDSTFDLVVAANVLAELSESDTTQYANLLARRVARGGHLVLIEPGQLAHTRRAMQIRDHLREHHPVLTPIFPCLRTDPCPMLQASQSDWCHGSLEWQQPSLHRQFDKLLGFNKHRIKFSSFIFKHGAEPLPGMRVLTPPEKTPRGVSGLVCGSELYGTVLISKRNRGEATRAFEKARVFDRLIFDPPCIDEAPDSLVVRATS
jgi:SAM-dependent methyltransferase